MHDGYHPRISPSNPEPRSVSFVRLGARCALAAISAGLIGIASRVGAQGTTGVISGRVTARADSAGTAAQGASVSVLGSALGATAGIDGRFLIEGVLTGPRTVRVRLLGYRTVEHAVLVRAGDTARVDVVLLPQAQLLPAIRADDRSADMEAFVSKPNVGTLTMGAAAMAAVPKIGEPDVVRVVQLLPGVEARNDFNTGLNVRGGEADQNLILLDGHPIYNPFHLGGLFSTFMDATVGGIELMTAAFPARYGGRLSSVLDVRSAEDARPGVHASADLSVLGATGRLAGAFGGGKGTWSVAGRRTYADALANVFTSDPFPYHFRDFHGRATLALPRDMRLAITGYVGRDVLDANMSEFESDSAPSRASEGRWAFDWGNRVLGATLSKEVGSATLELRISASGFSTLLNLADGTYTQRNAVRELSIGGMLQTRGVSHDVSAGYELATHHIRFASSSPQTGDIDYDLVQKPVTAALWAGDLWRLSSRWIVEGGLRAEGLTGGGRQWASLSPRVSVKYFATPDLALTAAAGRVTQVLHSLVGDGPLRYFDVWVASDSFIPVGTAWHWVAGAERRLRDVGSVRLEGYVKRYERVLDVNRSEDPGRRGDEFFAAQGLSYGLDMLARWQPTSGTSGWIAYSYGLSARWRDSVRWAPGHDRRHDVNVVATRRLAKYRLGLRFNYASGTPYTPIEGSITRRVYDPSRDHWGTGEPQLFIESLGGVRNGARFPATHRLDLDVSRDFHLWGAMVAPYVSVVNAYNAKNVFFYLYQYSTDRPTRRAISQFPVLPSLGVRVVF